MAPADTQTAEHAPAPASAPDPQQGSALEDAISVSYAVTSIQTPSYGLNYGALTLANHLWFSPGIEATWGARFGFGERLAHGYCAEGFGSIAVVPHFGTVSDAAGRTASWRPSLGLELGVTSADFYSVKLPANSPNLDGPHPNGVYGAFATRPLRFRFTRFNVSAVGLTFGTMLGHVGRQLRVQIELLQLGIVL